MSQIKRRQSKARYVYDIPYSKRHKICQMMDVGREWKRLAGALNYNADQIASLELVYQRPGGSPTDDLLRDWSYKNPTIDRLYRTLYHLHLVRPMRELQDLVSQEQRNKLPPDDSATVHIPPSHTPERSYERLNTNDLPLPSSTREFYPDQREKPLCDQQPYRPCRQDNNQDINLNPPPISGIPLPTKTTYRDKEFGCFGLNHEQQPHAFNKDSGPLKPSANASNPEVCRNQPEQSAESTDSLNLTSLPHFCHIDIEKATFGFSEECLLGDGGFAKVYKANLKNTTFAIKKLKPFDDPAEQARRKVSFVRELEALVKYVHSNIIQLFGYSQDGPEICLLYEYMANGSLQDRLMCKGGTAPLSWQVRQSILTGSAKGVQYLHTVRDKPLIHGDIKSANILLSKHMEPKIADFGLAKEATGGVEEKYTHVSRKKKKVPTATLR